MLALSSIANAAPGGQRFALVIANGDYYSFDALTATTTDGERIAAALNGTGFADASGSGPVMLRRDLTLGDMQKEIAAFRATLEAAGPEAFGVLYFSGHGAALSSFGDVALIAVDAGKTLTAESLKLTRAGITRDLLGSGVGNLLIVLDMCRNVVSLPAALTAAPTAETAALQVPAGSKGLQRVLRNGASAARPDQGYLVAYSTSPDQVAFDNGAFSRILAEEIRRPRQNVADALKRTSDRVAVSAMRDGRNFQKPTFDYGLQGAPPCFVSCDADSEDRFFDCASCPFMRVVPAGIATTGSPAQEAGRGKDEPLQRVERIERPFAIGIYEVTVSEWTACIKDGACKPVADWSKENPNPLLPAMGISYDDATAYVRWLNAQTGLSFRIPSEREWEYADRASSAAAFPWGDEISPSDANYDHSARYRGSPSAPYRGYPEAVNAYPPNGFGVYQMNGNAWEWTDGCIDTACNERVARGGSFDSAPDALRAANRFGVKTTKRRDDMGLRVVRDLNPDELTK